jgi:CRP/FNR family transcriptional regulator, cyclic AMP receptor protein
MADQSKYDALRGTKLAAELTDAQCRTLAEVVTLRDLREGEILVGEGTTDNHLYVIVKGVLGVVKGNGTPDATTLHTLATGDFADELGFLDDTVYYASKVALADTRVLGIEREKLESLLTSEPEIVYRVMRAIIRTVHQIQRRLSMQSVELTNYIYKQHGRY